MPTAADVLLDCALLGRSKACINCGAPFCFYRLTIFFRSARSPIVSKPYVACVYARVPLLLPAAVAAPLLVESCLVGTGVL